MTQHAPRPADGAGPPTPGYVTFSTLRADDRTAAAELARALAHETRRWLRHREGFVSARIHTGVDTAAAVVVREEWRSRASHRAAGEDAAGAALRALLTGPGVRETSVFGGVPEEGIAGPYPSAPPGLVCVATRHLGSPTNARRLAGLLREGDWKRHFPGFISATPYIGDEGTYVNYPQWTDAAAFDAYMRDPRNAAGQPGIAELEVAPPEIVMCTVLDEVIARTPTRGTK
ncbi:MULTISPECIES: putative quinol monooxygenase [unclassified Streptomyces]|uniref:putative quinol monooxygenase n=1 Tax=unclassified Streptomyces TaxID=2593676 RepID=UPI00278BED8A|nr:MULTISPECIES: antibiotic biosynthesis monooxygenase [unclassified Streptomyces]